MLCLRKHEKIRAIISFKHDMGRTLNDKELKHYGTRNPRYFVEKYFGFKLKSYQRNILKIYMNKKKGD